jgi:tetratricopeptide (TPR) repeat protein
MSAMTDPLRPYWDFDDLGATEARFTVLQAEIQTQLARIAGLREDYATGDRLLDAITDEAPRVRVRIDLERGRLRNSAGDKAAALPLFERAFETALAAGEHWLAGDAAHMCAIAAPDRAGFVAWTNRGLELARSSPAAAYWEGPLLNNLGWDHFEAEEFQWALELFEQALVVRERDPGNPAAIEHAREAIAEARKALGRD